MTQRTYFLVYADSSAAAEFLCRSLERYSRTETSVELLYKQDILSGKLENFAGKKACFFLPGNPGAQRYRDDLGEEGFAKIRNAVWEGMSFVGICAGGYMAASHVDYADQQSAKQSEGNLGIFQGMARGQLSLFNPEDGLRAGWKKAVTTPVTWIDKRGVSRKTKILYWGGPRYIPTPGENVDILATYDKLQGEDGNPALAVVAKRYGQGMAILSGIHAEVSGQDLKDLPQASARDTDGGSWREILFMTLAQYQEGQRGLFHRIVQKALPDVDPPQNRLARHVQTRRRPLEFGKCAL